MVKDDPFLKKSYSFNFPDSTAIFQRASQLIPVDKLNAAYWVVWLQGVGMLFPWNMYVTAFSYFEVRFMGTPFESSFENVFSVAFCFASVTGLAFSLKYQERIPSKHRVIGSLLVLIALSFCSTLLVLLPPTVLSGHVLFGITITSVMLSGWAVAALSGGIFGFVGKLPAMYTQAVMSGQGFAGLIVATLNLVTTAGSSSSNSRPPTYASLRGSTLLYFSISTGVVVLCLLTYLLLERLPFARFHMKSCPPTPSWSSDSVHSVEDASQLDNWLDVHKTLDFESPESSKYSRQTSPSKLASSKQTTPSKFTATPSKYSYTPSKLSTSTPSKLSTSESDPLLPSLVHREDSTLGSLDSSPSNSPMKRKLWRNLGHYETPIGAKGVRDSLFQNTSHGCLGGMCWWCSCGLLCDNNDGDQHQQIDEEQGSKLEDTNASIGQVVRKVRPLALAVGFIFFITLALFPATISMIRSVHNPLGIGNPAAGRKFGDLFLPLLFLIYNAGDFIGRITAGYLQLPANRLCFPILLRIAFIPLFLMCNLQSRSRQLSYLSHKIPFLFSTSDAWPITIMSLFALSNGYLSALCMMYGPSFVQPRDRETAGTVMILFLQSGLFLGSLFSFAVKEILYL